MGVIWCLATSGVALAQSGIVVWKDFPTQTDADVRMVAFDRMMTAGGTTWFYKGEKRRGFEKNQFFRYVIVPPSLPAELIKEEQYTKLHDHFDEISNFAKHFPGTGSILNPQLGVMRGVLDDFAAGKVYFTGKWMPRADYDKLMAERDAAITRKRATSEQRQADARNRAYATVGGIAIYLVFLIGACIRRLRKLILLLILLPSAAACWLTYRDGGYEWAKDLRKYLMDLPAQLQLPEQMKLLKAKLSGR